VYEHQFKISKRKTPEDAPHMLYLKDRRTGDKKECKVKEKLV
jgi:hypothetical protein